MERKTIIYLVSWTTILFVFWLLLSGFLKPLLISFGVVSVALVVFLVRRMDVADQEQQKLAFNFKFFKYIGWLMGQVVLSSIDVTKLVWGNKQKISPALEKLPLEKVPEQSRVLYANSITMTPGTLSVDIDDKYVTVHALHQDSIDGLKHGDMAEKVYAGTEKET